VGGAFEYVTANNKGVPAERVVQVQNVERRGGEGGVRKGRWKGWREGAGGTGKEGERGRLRQ
jgi:hypothetical protein